MAYELAPHAKLSVSKRWRLELVMLSFTPLVASGVPV